MFAHYLNKGIDHTVLDNLSFKKRLFYIAAMDVDHSKQKGVKNG